MLAKCQTFGASVPGPKKGFTIPIGLKHGVFDMYILNSTICIHLCLHPLPHSYTCCLLCYKINIFLNTVLTNLFAKYLTYFSIAMTKAVDRRKCLLGLTVSEGEYMVTITRNMVAGRQADMPQEQQGSELLLWKDWLCYI